jgi:hypothetical protein
VSRFNQFIGERLLDGALRTLDAQRVSPRDVVVVRVPGAFEIPVVAKRLAQSGVVRRRAALPARPLQWVAGASRGMPAPRHDRVPSACPVETLDRRWTAWAASTGTRGEVALGAIEMGGCAHAARRRSR